MDDEEESFDVGDGERAEMHELVRTLRAELRGLEQRNAQLRATVEALQLELLRAREGRT